MGPESTRARRGAPWMIGALWLTVALVLSGCGPKSHGGTAASATGSAPSTPATSTAVADPTHESAAQAAQLALTPLRAASSASTCGSPAALAGRMLPGETGAVRCLSTVQLDLDGDGRPDRLALYTTATARGAVGYLADGSIHPLVDGDVQETDRTLAWTRISDPQGDLNVPVRTVQLGTGGGQQLLVGDSQGAHGYGEVMLGLRDDGGLALVQNGHGRAVSLVQADDYGCAAKGSEKALVVTISGRGSAGQQSPDVAGWGVSHLFYGFDGRALSFLGYQGNVLKKAPATDPFVNDCSSAPAMPGLLPVARTASAAASAMAKAVAQQYKPGMETVSAGGLADFSGESSASADAWKFLTDEVHQSLIPASGLAKPAFRCQLADDRVTRNCLDYLSDHSGVVLINVRSFGRLTDASLTTSSLWLVVGADFLDWPE